MYTNSKNKRRFPILNPRNIPEGYPYIKTPYFYFEPTKNNYVKKFENYFNSWVYK